MEKKVEEYTSISLPQATNEEKKCMDSSESQGLLPTPKKDAIKLSNNDDENSINCRSKCEKAKVAIKIIFTWFVWSLLGLIFLHSLYNWIYPIPSYVEECGFVLDYNDTLFPPSIQQTSLDFSIEGLADLYGKDFLNIKCFRHRNVLPVADVNKIRQPAISSGPLYMDTKQNSDVPEAIDYSNVIVAPVATKLASFENHLPRRAEFSNAPDSSSYINGPSVSDTIPPSKYGLNSGILSSQTATVDDLPLPSSSVSTEYVEEKDSVSMHSDNSSPLLFYLMENHTRYFSVPEDQFYMLKIYATDDLDVTTEIMTASQAHQADTGKINIYLKPDNNDNYHFDDHAFNRQVNFTMTTSNCNSKVARLNIERNQKETTFLWHKKTIKCQLQIVLPNSFSNDNDKQHTFVSKNVTNNNNGIHPALRYLSIKVKEGQVQASRIALDHLNAVSMVDLTAVVLNGNVNIQGVKIMKNLASGVARGSSVVIAKVHPEYIGEQNYSIINMCSDGYTYTDVMTTEENREQLAADFSIYRQTGTLPRGQFEPCLFAPDTYYIKGEENLAHVNKGSTDVFKTGYLARKHTGSHISVYSGAKSPESYNIKSRFLYGYYTKIL
ncbi:hypothetical protein INT45_003423 [Circinella minor]|uniref:Uncharacterized protein n=1 Tax=Circinella minor TaxID=1195481 RepID=A0A8H7VMD5_9FUNG|nr:hypothetical protein INT45_003423 [Circinella minor]